MGIRTVIFDPSPRGRLPYIFELPVQRPKLTVRKAAAAAVELDFGLVEVGLEDLGRVAPGGEIGDGVGFVGDLVLHTFQLS